MSHLAVKVNWSVLWVTLIVMVHCMVGVKLRNYMCNTSSINVRLSVESWKLFKIFYI